MARVIPNQYCTTCHKRVPAQKSLFHAPACPECGTRAVHVNSFYARRDRKRVAKASTNDAA